MGKTLSAVKIGEKRKRSDQDDKSDGKDTRSDSEDEDTGESDDSGSESETEGSEHLENNESLGREVEALDGFAAEMDVGVILTSLELRDILSETSLIPAAKPAPVAKQVKSSKAAERALTEEDWSEF